jgi:NAD(P)-dependent dehydrogenase (short-subunit alcohol dehydrogenase family)
MRSVLISGVSRGLGAALFDLLCGRGDRVVAIGRRFSDAERSRADREPDLVRLVTADLADPPDLRATFAAALVGAESAVLIHNAAVVDPVGPIGAVPDTDLRTAATVNLTAPMLLTNAFLAARPAALPATILFISSGAAHHPIEGWAAYCATKAGGEMFFATVAAEHPDVRVRSVNPGRMDTGMQATLRGSTFPSRADFVAAHERGELPDPADVARRIVAEHLPA